VNKKENADPETDSLFGGLIRAVIIFAVCCYLVNLGVCYLVSVRVPLIIIAVIVGIIIVSYRVYKWRKDHDNY